MKNTKTKKNSAAKKLIPATSMLLVSATMLATSTYAWFTMSREVEVSGIKLTATVPENIQVSLGNNTGMVHSSTTTGDNGLDFAVAPQEGKYGLVKYSQIKAPDGAQNGNAEDPNTTDWYNSVDFSQHYVAGKLKPVSSTDGNFLFKTGDATIQGKDVDKMASFTAVTTSDEAGLYCIGSLANDTETISSLSYQYVTNSGTNEKYIKEGYYIDFPVWFRTTSLNDTVNKTGGYITADGSGNYFLNLGVIANVKQRTATTASEDLYHAVRVAVLKTTDNTNAANSDMVTTGSMGVVANYDDYAAGTATSNAVYRYYDRYSSTGSGSARNGAINVKASDMTTLTTMTNQAVYAGGSLIWNPSDNAVTNLLNHYGMVDYVKQPATLNDEGYTDGESVVKIPVATESGKYGYSDRYVIRVWLEGEDINCWNETAGQDWDISLKFVKLKSTDSNDTDHATYPVTATPTASSATTSKETASDASIASQTVTLNFNNGSSNFATVSYTYSSGYAKNTTDTQKWKYIATYGQDIDKAVWQFADGTKFANEDDFIAYLNKYAGKYDLSSLTLTSSNYSATAANAVKSLDAYVVSNESISYNAALAESDVTYKIDNSATVYTSKNALETALKGMTVDTHHTVYVTATA